MQALNFDRFITDSSILEADKNKQITEEGHDTAEEVQNLPQKNYQMPKITRTNQNNGFMPS